MVACFVVGDDAGDDAGVFATALYGSPGLMRALDSG